MRTLCVSLALVVLFASTAFSGVNAGPTWNLFATQFNFDRYPAGDNGSFAAHYNGSNLASDFNGIMSAMNQAMGSTHIGAGYDDLMDATLENWGTDNSPR
jgi:hypothetical protein